MQKDKNFLPHISYKNAAYIVQCSKHQWSQITSRVNLGVKCLNVNNIKRQISHTCVLDRILESGSVGQHIILLFSLKGKKPHIRAHSEIADKTSSLLPVPLIPHIEKKQKRWAGGKQFEAETFHSDEWDLGECSSTTGTGAAELSPASTAWGRHVGPQVRPLWTTQVNP